MLTDADVKKVAHLARLDLADSEIATLTTQLSAILDYVQQLDELEVSNIAPTTRAIEVSNVTRVDQLNPFPNRPGLLAIAPEAEDEFFRVPKILADAE
ncbi:glutamyl-tRNA(Gln) and/or aspartyl-tRNA(Asn) amidotransferase, C subunit [Synechococcus sp. PCC 6312]|nr:glutamyl-tRNA(Gln) and/or aspartyl-tRNA(Asn) amidotransferase, C subunit [Synechococcus sp. PCC 6312]